MAPAAGTYRAQIKAFDRFDVGDQVAPGEPVPVVGTASGSYTLRLDDAAVAVRMHGVDPPVREEYSSARLRRLAQELRTGQGDALPSFWREVAGKGPLVEEIPGNDRDVDVTFLWRETYDVQNVLVLWAGRVDDGYMSHLPGTDIWYKTVRLRRGKRIDYRISPNDRPADRGLTAQLDPLNPRKYPEDPTYPFLKWSVLDMPGAHRRCRELGQVRRGRVPPGCRTPNRRMRPSARIHEPRRIEEGYRRQHQKKADESDSGRFGRVPRLGRKSHLDRARQVI